MHLPPPHGLPHAGTEGAQQGGECVKQTSAAPAQAATVTTKFNMTCSLPSPLDPLPPPPPPTHLHSKQHRLAMPNRRTVCVSSDLSVLILHQVSVSLTLKSLSLEYLAVFHSLCCVVLKYSPSMALPAMRTCIILGHTCGHPKNVTTSLIECLPSAESSRGDLTFTWWENMAYSRSVNSCM